MQAHSRWLHAIRKCVITEEKRGVKKLLKYAIVFASTQLRITRLRKYPIDPKAYLGHCIRFLIINRQSHRGCAYIFTFIACLSEYQTSGFYCTWNKSHRLVDISCLHPFCKVFALKDLTWGDILFIELKLYCVLASRKKSIHDWHLYITQKETKWTKWYEMTSHVISYRSTELLFGTHSFNFNCFFDDFNCVFTQIHCLSRLLDV